MKAETLKDKGDIVIYEGKGGRPRLEVRLARDTLWLSLNQLARMFDRDRSVISRHLRNIYATKKLDRQSTAAEYATVQREGTSCVLGR